MGVMARLTGRRTFGTGEGHSLSWLVDAKERARCEEAPEEWVLEAPAHALIFAYDPSLQRSHNPNAPALSPESWAVLRNNEMVIDLLGLSRGGTFAARLAPSGRCAVVATAWLPVYTGWRLYLPILACGVLAAICGAMLSSFAVVRHLVRRVALVRDMASRVGASSGYSAVETNADDDLAQVARALDAAHARIRSDAHELERQRTELQGHIADVAHDLRTPLASLQLALQQASTSGAKSEEARGALLRAVEDVVYIGGLVANLRLASELREGGTLRAQTPVPLGEIVERAALRLQFLARQKGIALEVSVPETPLQVTGDPIAIEQAVANVIENAVAHNDPGTHVAVLLEPAGADFHLSITDDGPGVELAEVPHLTERTFRSGAARQRDGRGEGLGLAITSEVCRQLGWHLTFSRMEPSGLCVKLQGHSAALESRVHGIVEP
jgi:signal transduction histidine kinase